MCVVVRESMDVSVRESASSSSGGKGAGGNVMERKGFVYTRTSVVVSSTSPPLSAIEPTLTLINVCGHEQWRGPWLENLPRLVVAVPTLVVDCYCIIGVVAGTNILFLLYNLALPNTW